jgi:hypothetical protein
MMVDGLVTFFTFIVILPGGELVDRLHCLIFLRRCYSDCAGHEMYQYLQYCIESFKNILFHIKYHPSNVLRYCNRNSSH